MKSKECSIMTENVAKMAETVVSRVESSTSLVLKASIMFVRITSEYNNSQHKESTFYVQLGTTSECDV